MALTDESIKIILSSHKMLLHDYTKFLNMILHPLFHDLNFFFYDFSRNGISLHKCELFISRKLIK